VKNLEVSQGTISFGTRYASKICIYSLSVDRNRCFILFFSLIATLKASVAELLRYQAIPTDAYSMATCISRKGINN
jgi:hypothetical protein